jgi:hypothetical protein
MNGCEHSMQDMYIETATGRRGCNECDEAKAKPQAPIDHSDCSRRRFGSGCVPFQEKSE